MRNTYNIYKINSENIKNLLLKLKNVGLIEQRTIKSKNYSLTFYFSENEKGNEVWWAHTYRDFFKNGVSDPKNIFYFGLLLCQSDVDKNTIYVVSLGKSHFYLSKYIENDFGITLAVRMADEQTILLKKSRYFTGIKRQDVSSYQKFQKDNYEAGESVEHLKLKASNKNIWGDKNIIFADSIQMDVEKSPLDMPDIFDQIDAHLSKDEVINLPKLELVDSSIKEDLDKAILASLRKNEGEAIVEEFQVYGVTICFSFHDYDYQIYAKKPEGEGYYRENIGNSLEIDAISGFLRNHPDICDVNTIKVKFKNNERDEFSKEIKELISFPITHNDKNYFLRNGEWYRFNQTFLMYLKRSLQGIKIDKMDDLDENDYIDWKIKKEKEIAAHGYSGDKLTYREYYFNKKQEKNGFQVLDRVLSQIKSLKNKKSDYRVEVADLYKNKEIISVKISEAKHELIYNIEQSKDSIELIKRGVIEFKSKIKCAALWFVFEDDVEKITDINSIQFLLAIESWNRLVRSLGYIPKIYISKHINSKK